MSSRRTRRGGGRGMSAESYMLQQEEEEFSSEPPPQNKSSRSATKNSSSSTAAAPSSNKSNSRKRSSTGNKNRSKHPPGNDKLYSSHPSNGTYDKLTHEDKPPLPSATTNPKPTPRNNLQKIKALNGSNQPDPMVDITDLLALCQPCTDEDTKETTDEIKDKSDNLPEDTWDKSHGNFIECDTCNSAPATTRPVVPDTDPKKGKPGAFPNTICAACANNSPGTFMTRPCCMADGNEVRKGRGKTCQNCHENRVCVNFETCNGKKRYSANNTVFETCETCYKASIANRACETCGKIGIKEGRAICADCARSTNNAAKDKQIGRDKDERCDRCYHLMVEGSQRYFTKASVGLKVCSRNNCDKKCRMVLRKGADGKNIYCDDEIKPGQQRAKTCGGYSKKTYYDANGNKKQQLVHKCLNTDTTMLGRGGSD